MCPQVHSAHHHKVPLQGDHRGTTLYTISLTINILLCSYLLLSPAGLFDDKFGDVSSPGVSHVPVQVVWLLALSPLTQQSGLSTRGCPAASAQRELRAAHCDQITDIVLCCNVLQCAVLY